MTQALQITVLHFRRRTKTDNWSSRAYASIQRLKLFHVMSSKKINSRTYWKDLVRTSYNVFMSASHCALSVKTFKGLRKICWTILHSTKKLAFRDTPSPKCGKYEPSEDVDDENFDNDDVLNSHFECWRISSWKLDFHSICAIFIKMFRI